MEREQGSEDQGRAPRSSPLALWGARAQDPGAVSGADRASSDRASRWETGHGAPQAHSMWRAILRSLRPHQWLKNCLVLVPAALAHRPLTVSLILELFAAFASFCLVASAVYTINDLADVEADRLHPTKRGRPYASRELPLWLAPLLALLLLGLGLTVAVAWVRSPFPSMLLGYFGINVAYSLWLKQKLIVDVVLLAGLYTWRILAGGVAAGVTVSEWLLAASMFGFTSLAFVKRYSNLRQTEDGTTRRGYVRDDLETVAMLGSASGFMTVLVMALYVSSDRVRTLYAEPSLLWLVCPLLLYWFGRVWLLARRGAVSDDPVVFVARDPVSLLTGVLISIVGYVAAVGF